MHLILGHRSDPCCSGVEAGLRERGLPVRLVDMPFAPPALFSLRIESDGTPLRARGALKFDDTDSEVESVLVRASGRLDRAGWDTADHAYMQAEVQAVLLAWLAALDCPVINRAAAEIWYRPRNPLLYWVPLLRRCGLPAPETVMTDDPNTAREFRCRLEADHMPGAACASLLREGTWLVRDDDWAGVAALQARAPVCLMEPHHGAHSACVVGGQVIWDGQPELVLADLAPSMIRFAKAAQLDFLELALARVRRGWAVVHIDPLPRLEHFGASAQSLILETLVGLLTGSARQAPELLAVSP